MKNVLLRQIAIGTASGSMGQTEPDPAAAMENFRQCLARINSPARYEAFLRCGYPVLLRDDARTPEQTMALAAERFGLTR